MKWSFPATTFQKWKLNLLLGDTVVILKLVMLYYKKLRPICDAALVICCFE